MTNFNKKQRENSIKVENLELKDINQELKSENESLKEDLERLNKQILNPNWSSYNAQGDCKKKAKDDINVEIQVQYRKIKESKDKWKNKQKLLENGLSEVALE